MIGQPSYQPNPPGGQNTPGGPQTSNNKNKIVVIAAILIGLLVLLNGVMYWWGDKKINIMKGEATEKDLALKDLKDKYEAAVLRLDSIKMLFPAKRDSINELITLLAQRDETIRQNISNGASLNAARKQISDLTHLNESLKSRLDEMQSENSNLKATNQQLTQDLSRITQELDFTKDELNKIKEKQGSGTNPENNGNTDNTSGSGDQNIDNSSSGVENKKPIPVSGVKVGTFYVNPKNPNQARKWDKAKNVDRVIVDFTAMPASGVQPGTQKFSVQIIGPSQNSIGSIEGKDAEFGTKITFAGESTIEYSGSNQKLDQPIIINGGGYSPGVHQVVIWNKGQKVGSGSFKLK